MVMMVMMRAGARGQCCGLAGTSTITTGASSSSTSTGTTLQLVPLASGC
jgi:hypothetical protein